MPDQLFCPVHKTVVVAEPSSYQPLTEGTTYRRAATDASMLACMVYACCQPICHSSPCAKPPHGYRELEVEVLCRRLCSSQEIWECRSPLT